MKWLSGKWLSENQPQSNIKGINTFKNKIRGVIYQSIYPSSAGEGLSGFFANECGKPRGNSVETWKDCGKSVENMLYYAEKARGSDVMRKSKRAELWRRVREVIRAYPGMSAAADAGTLPPQRRREYEAVRDALRRAERLPDGEWRFRLIRQTLIYPERTVAGAALDCHISERTARNWNGAFLLNVARNLNWI